MRHAFEPRLVNGPFGDPGLYVDFRDERRALLFDLGDVAALPPRKLLRLTHAFVTHAHMDHFAGFDPLLRVVLGRKARIVLTGGPDFVERVGHKLQAYAWNVVHRYEVPLEIEAHAIGEDGVVRAALFSSRERFDRRDLPARALAGDVVLEEETFRVRARFLDHELPCLAFALEQKARVRVARDRLDALGLTTGPWLRELKKALLEGAPGDTPIRIRWRDRQGEHADSRPVDELRQAILDVGPGRRIGYATDLRYTEANVQALVALLAGVDVLFIECVFLEEDAGHALRKNHLTARQAGDIARRVGARAVVPFHFSPRYGKRPAALLEELHAAWKGPPANPGAPPA